MNQPEPYHAPESTPNFQPRISIQTSREGLPDQGSHPFHARIRIEPPEVPVRRKRPRLNLAIVLDRSGSMGGGGKLSHAKAAARFLFRQLRDGDIISLAVFSNEIEVVAPAAPKRDQTDLLERLRSVRAGGRTALHEGWVEGCLQLGENSGDGWINRVILLSDGLANVGITSRRDIAGEAGRLAERGITTSTLGVGDSYDEDLLQQMAEAGGGSYYYIDRVESIAEAFATEFEGIVDTVARDVVIELKPGTGIHIQENLNDLVQTGEGRWRLPDLIAGHPLDLLFGFRTERADTAPGAVGRGEREVVSCKLEYRPVGSELDDIRTCQTSLRHPLLPVEHWEKLPVDPDLFESVHRLMLARLKRRASVEMDRRNAEGALRELDLAGELVGFLHDPEEQRTELEELGRLVWLVRRREMRTSSKMAKYGHYRTSKGRAWTRDRARHLREDTPTD